MPWELESCRSRGTLAPVMPVCLLCSSCRSEAAGDAEMRALVRVLCLWGMEGVPSCLPWAQSCYGGRTSPKATYVRISLLKLQLMEAINSCTLRAQGLAKGGGV